MNTLSVAPEPASVTSTPPNEANLDHVFVAVAKYFALLSDPTRLKVLHTICRAEHHVSAIVVATGISQTNVSRHLAVLRHSGIVARRRVRNAVFYRIADQAFVDVCRTVCAQMASRTDVGTPLREELLTLAAEH